MVRKVAKPFLCIFLSLIACGIANLRVHASGSGPIFAISQGSYSLCTQNCTWSSYFDQVSVVNSGGVSSVGYDYFGDGSGQISQANNGYPILQLYFAKAFAYNPGSLTDLHLFASYWVNAYVYASNNCCGTSAWLFGQYRITTTAPDGSKNEVIPAHRFEYDVAITSCSPNCPGNPSITSVNQAKAWDNDIGGNCPTFCNFSIGQQYTLEIMFEITANPGAYVQNVQGNGPAYVDLGLAGSNQDFTNHQFCIVLSYQNQPISECPTGTISPVPPNPPFFTIIPSSTSIHQCAGGVYYWPFTVQSNNGFQGTVKLSSSDPNGQFVYSWVQPPGNVTLSSGSAASGSLGVASQLNNNADGAYNLYLYGTNNGAVLSATISLAVSITYCSGSGGGGGSVAYGSLVTMADGGQVPIQNLQTGDLMMGYDISLGQFTTSRILSFENVTTSNMMVIDTAAGIPFRVDANPRQTLWTKAPDGSTGWIPVTSIQRGDELFTPNGWTPVTKIEFAPRGQHTMFEIVASMPYFADHYLDPMWKM